MQMLAEHLALGTGVLQRIGNTPLLRLGPDYRRRGTRQMAILRLSEKIAQGIRDFGARDYPNETCGALLGTESEDGREVRALLSLTNRREDSPRNRFSITPNDFRVAERAASEQGLELLGWYHSHPDHPARPSEFDREHAWPWYSYVIVSVDGGNPQRMTSWLLAEDRSHFDFEEIVIRDNASAAK